MTPSQLTGLVGSALIAASAASTVTRQSTPPQTFRSGVELILLEATVLDKDGRPIPDLQAKELTVKIGGKTRAVAALEYIPAGRLGASPSDPAVAATPSPAGAPSVEAARAQLRSMDRTFVLAIDVENIRSGAGRNALVDVAEYVATLPATDRIGIMTLPGGGTTVEPTTDRAAIRAALSRMAGTDHRMNSCDATIGEAAAEAANDERGMAAFSDRVKPPRCPSATRRALQSFALQYRTEARRTLAALTSLAKRLSVIQGRRTIVLVSEGIYMDDEIVKEDLANFGAALEQSRAVLYAIHLDFPLSEASSQFTSSSTRLLDDRYGFDGMADAAVFGGGGAVRAISRATPAIRRIDQELSGTYLLGVERLPADPVGKQLTVKIEVSRKGTEVRARQTVTISGR